MRTGAMNCHRTAVSARHATCYVRQAVSRRTMQRLAVSRNAVTPVLEKPVVGCEDDHLVSCLMIEHDGDEIVEDISIERTKLEEKMKEDLGGTVFERISAMCSGVFDASDRKKGLILLNLMTFIMATNCVVVKDAEAFLDPFTFSALRFSIATIAMIPFLKNLTNIRKDVAKAGCELGFWSALGYLSQSIGLLSTDASRAAFLGAFTVILVPILAGMSGKGVSRTTWVAASIALLGTALLEQGGGAAPSVGDAFNVLSALFFAIQVIRTEHYSRTMSDQTTSLLATSLGTTAVVSGALAVGVHPANCWHMVQNFTSAGIPWKDVIYTGVLSTDLVLFIELVALNNVSSTDAAIIYTMEPVIGALLAYFLLGERWGPMGWVGASLILMSSLGTQLLDDNDNLDTVEGQS